MLAPDFFEPVFSLYEELQSCYYRLVSRLVNSIYIVNMDVYFHRMVFLVNTNWIGVVRACSFKVLWNIFWKNLFARISSGFCAFEKPIRWIEKIFKTFFSAHIFLHILFHKGNFIKGKTDVYLKRTFFISHTCLKSAIKRLEWPWKFL